MNDAILTTSSIEQHCWKQDGCWLDDCCENSPGQSDQLVHLISCFNCIVVKQYFTQHYRQTDRWTTGLCTVRTGCRNWNYCTTTVPAKLPGLHQSASGWRKWRRKCCQFPPITQLLQRRRRAWLVSPSIGLHRNFTTDPPEYQFHNHSEKLISARVLS